MNDACPVKVIPESIEWTILHSICFAARLTAFTLVGSMKKIQKTGDRDETTEVAEKFAAFGFVPDPTTPAALAALIESDTVVYADMIKRTGASAE
jgi:streptomycin 6-kinase